MKILIVSEVFWPEDFVVNDLAQEWQRMGHQVEVLTQYPSYPQSYVFDGYENKGEMTEDWNGIKIHRFPFIDGYCNSKIKKFANYLSFINEGKRIAKRIGGNFDAIFVSQTGPLTVALPAIAAGKKFGVPVAIWTQDIWPDVVWSYGVPKWGIIKYWLDKLIGHIYNNCDHIFVSSKRFEDIICQYTRKEIVYTPNWLRPTEETESDIRLDKSKFHFTFTGNVSRYQNLVITVLGFDKAFSGQQSAVREAVLNIVGNGSYLEQVKEVVELHQIKNVVFHGKKPYSMMNDILTQSDVLVLPLINDEGIMRTEPFKIQSYLHAGKPIMGILGGSGKEIIEENQLGLVAQPDDISDIARVFRESIAFANAHSDEIHQKASLLMNTRFNREEIIRRITEGMRNEE